MKILITGNAGSGKSSFGKKLSEKLSLPLHGLDKIVWEEGWKKTPRDKKEKLIKEITDKDSWIIEGVSKKALEKADKVYFLDISTPRCIFNIIKRFLKNGLSTRDDLPKNCPEYIGFIKAIKVVFIYNKLTKPWLNSELNNRKTIHIKSYSELSKLR